MDQQPSASRKPAKLRPLLARAAGVCVGLSGLVTLSGGPCPCCGQPACPTGAVGIGLLGAALALAAQVWKRITRP